MNYVLLLVTSTNTGVVYRQKVTNHYTNRARHSFTLSM